MMKMAAVGRLIGIRLGHKRSHKAIALRNLLNAILEGEGVVCRLDASRWSKIDLHLPGTILGIRSDDVHADCAHPAQNLIDQGFIEVVPQGGKNLNTLEWRL